jgi:hypothetical protein
MHKIAVYLKIESDAEFKKKINQFIKSINSKSKILNIKLRKYEYEVDTNDDSYASFDIDFNINDIYIDVENENGKGRALLPSKKFLDLAKEEADKIFGKSRVTPRGDFFLDVIINIYLANQI